MSGVLEGARKEKKERGGPNRRASALEALLSCGDDGDGQGGWSVLEQGIIP